MGKKVHVLLNSIPRPRRSPFCRQGKKRCLHGKACIPPPLCKSRRLSIHLLPPLSQPSQQEIGEIKATPTPSYRPHQERGWRGFDISFLDPPQEGVFFRCHYTSYTFSGVSNRADSEKKGSAGKKRFGNPSAGRPTALTQNRSPQPPISANGGHTERRKKRSSFPQLNGTSVLAPGFVCGGSERRTSN